MLGVTNSSVYKNTNPHYADMPQSSKYTIKTIIRNRAYKPLEHTTRTKPNSKLLRKTQSHTTQMNTNTH